MVKDFINDRLEDISAASTCFIVLQIDWQYEAIRFCLGIGASILSGYIVNRLKKTWDKKDDQK